MSKQSLAGILYDLGRPLFDQLRHPTLEAWERIALLAAFSWNSSRFPAILEETAIGHLFDRLGGDPQERVMVRKVVHDMIERARQDWPDDAREVKAVQVVEKHPRVYQIVVTSRRRRAQVSTG